MRWKCIYVYMVALGQSWAAAFRAAPLNERFEERKRNAVALFLVLHAKSVVLEHYVEWESEQCADRRCGIMHEIITGLGIQSYVTGKCI